MYALATTPEKRKNKESSTEPTSAEGVGSVSGGDGIIVFIERFFLPPAHA